jgi:hypothetical protein
MNDLDRAITMNEQAVTSTPEDYPNRSVMLHCLGSMLQRRFEKTGSMDDLNQAITKNEQAVAIHTAPPSIRIRAADSASKLLIGRD